MVPAASPVMMSQKRQGRVVRGLLLELGHPAQEHVARAGAVDPMKFATVLNEPLTSAKHRRPVGDDHGNH